MAWVASNLRRSMERRQQGPAEANARLCGIVKVCQSGAGERVQLHSNRRLMLLPSTKADVEPKLNHNANA